MIPFMVAMLFAGRGVGTFWRSRKESALRLAIYSYVGSRRRLTLCSSDGLFCLAILYRRFSDERGGSLVKIGSQFRPDQGGFMLENHC